MKILVMTVGTRGDVQPFLALALGLREAGHDVVVAGPTRFTAFAATRGVDFVGVDDGPLRLLDEPDAYRALEGGIRVRAGQLRALPAMFARLLDDCAAIAAGGPGSDADVVVHNGQILAGQHIAEALGVPAVLALPLPLYVPTREFPWPGWNPPSWWPALGNRATWTGMRLPALAFARTVDRWRARTLGLPPRRARHDPLKGPDGSAAPVLHAISPRVVTPAADWPSAVRTTGYWFLPPTGEALPARVGVFLDAGDPPVYVGFGSMTGANPTRRADAVRAAAHRLGVRLVLATGWGGLDATDSDDDVLVVDEVDHAALLPRTAAVIHHGGAGTVAAAVAAGRPQVVCPFTADQPFWARRVEALGVASPPVPRRRLDVRTITPALGVALSDRTMDAAAERLGERVRAEDGVGDAVRTLERIVER